MLTASQIARALGVTKGRVYRALSRPYPLPYMNSPYPVRPGGQERLYSISVLLPRLKEVFAPEPDLIKALFREGGHNG